MLPGGGLDIFKEALQVSVAYLDVNLLAIKVGDLKRILLLGPSMSLRRYLRFQSRKMGLSSEFDRPQLCSP